MIEYSLLLAILAAGSLAFVNSSSGSVSSIWSTANLTLQGQTTSPSGSGGTSGNLFAGDHHDRDGH